uniref:Epimerase family protein SDR39U1 n=1 Tax=Lygus hesperus TaxID=30085 RepID=A0A146MAQ1_LYGHE
MSVSRGHVLLGGGTGFVGSALKQLLISKKYEVTVISRMPGARRVTWFDVCSSGLPDGVTAVVNLAGQNILDPLQRWTAGFKQNVWNSRVNTTHTLAQAITNAKRKPDVFVTVSGVGIYDPTRDDLYDEYSTISEPFDFLSKLAVEWEKAGKLEEADVRHVVIRSGVVLGRGGGMIQQMFLPFYFGLGGPIGSGCQPLPWIHLKDLCNLFVFAIENPEVSGVLNGVAPQVVTNDEFTRSFATVLSRPAFFRVPQFALNLLFSEERAKIMTMGQRVCPKRVQELGFQYEYPDIDSALKSVSHLLYSKKKPF